jgi:hypothetical protein
MPPPVCDVAPEINRATYYLKQLAQEVARTQPGVRRVINTIIVGR